MNNYKMISRIKWLIDATNEQISKLTITINSLNEESKKIPSYLINANYKSYQMGKSLLKEGKIRLEKMLLDNYYSVTEINKIKIRYFSRSEYYFRDSYRLFCEYSRYVNSFLLPKVLSNFQIVFMYIHEILDLFSKIC